MWVATTKLLQVCVKVQHNGVDSLMKTDLATIEFISNRMLKRHPDAPDFRETCLTLSATWVLLEDLIREWKRASREEVPALGWFLVAAKFLSYFYIVYIISILNLYQYLHLHWSPLGIQTQKPCPGGLSPLSPPSCGQVDFQLEAQNALQASRALKRHQLDVTCPEPIKSLCSQRVPRSRRLGDMPLRS